MSRDRDFDRDRDYGRGGDEEFGGFGGLRGGRAGGRKCRACDFVDFKDLQALRRATTPQGKISGRKRTNSCAKCQRLTAQAVKRARYMGILGFTS
jgi:small subunit ribosomal protein S18